MRFHPYFACGGARTATRFLLTAGVVLGTQVATAGQTGVKPPLPRNFKTSSGPPTSGIYDFRGDNLGPLITECPQARLANVFPEPLDRRVRDAVEQYSDRGDDLRTNEEFGCFPQNETSIAVNPASNRNIVAGANDYRLGTGSSGVYASVDGGRTWYGTIVPFPTVPFGQGFLVSGGDPAVVFDRAGVAYYAQIAFNRDDDSNGVFVSRSTNGGYTWTRARAVATDATPPNPVLPGDGVVVVQLDNDFEANSSVTIHDKEYIAAGPRPPGVEPQCFTPVSHEPKPCDAAFVGVDRLYVSWTAFNNPTEKPELIVSSTIEVSYSDDQGRSWSPRRTVNGSAPFCEFSVAGNNRCDDNQFSTPTVSPHTGFLYVAFENFNTPDENQYLVVRSHDGGQTYQGPFFVTPVFDVNFPRAGAGGTRNRPDCTARGQQGGRMVYTNSCFRSNAAGNIVVDKRSGSFADDLYLVMSDNRNGTRESSNADIFLFKSINGGMNWVGPTRVNTDPSGIPQVRDCGRQEIGMAACAPNVHTGNDQWWPWMDINERGHLNIVFSDRRLDVNSVAHEWSGLGSRQRPGNYLVWFWGAQCTVDEPDSRDCLARAATTIPQPTGVINPRNELVPGQGKGFVGPFRNFGISDTPSNWDYSFRGGIFAGDYNGMTVDPHEQKAWGFWTDARNGRASANPPPSGTFQVGRNPICEQSDVMVQAYSSSLGGRRDDDHGRRERGGRDDGEGSHDGSSPGQSRPRSEDSMFLITPCPVDATGHYR
jgi:hypothetical protein